MRAFARIDRDRLAETDDDPTYETRKGFTFGDVRYMTNRPTETTRHRFSLIDDDGETYYQGTIYAPTEEDAEIMAYRLWEWGAYDSGTTLLKLDGEPFIG